MSKLRKIFTISVMFVTVLSMSVVVAPQVDAAASAGDLIKMDGLSSVYYLGADGKRYVFPNEQTYFSWYSDFSGVVTIPQSELESYSLGANVTMRAGTKLVKITTDPKVYAVQPNGTLIWVPSEETAISLFGANWAQKVVDVPDAFFTNYTVSTGQVSATAYPAGSLIQMPGSSTVYYINGDGNAQEVSTEASFLANRFKWSDVVTTGATFVLPALGSAITGASGTIVDTSQGGGAGTGITAGAGTGLTVSLSGITSPSSTLVEGQAIANLASFNLTASNDGAVKVTTFVVRRAGVSADATLSAVYLYDGVKRLTDSASVSSGSITWNNSAGIIEVPAGQTKTITVKSNLAASASGQTVSVKIEAASSLVTNGAAVSGSFPISGNMHSIASATLATVDFGTVTPSSNGAPNPQDDFKIWSDNVTIGNRAVDLEYITFRQIGSVLTPDLQNFDLYISGVRVGDSVATVDSNGYITFDLSASPYRLETGTREFKVLVDIIGGSTRTCSLSLRQTSDISVIDTEYNVPVLSTVSSAVFSARSSTAQIIAGGALTITKKTNSASGSVVDDASNVSLGSFEFKATGEPIKVETLRINAITSLATVDELRNGKIYANGIQVGSTADIYTANGTVTTNWYTDYSLGSSLIVNPGSPVTVEIKADVYDSDGTDHIVSGTTIQVQIASTTTSNYQKMVSLGYDSAPTVDKVGNTLTVKTGSIVCSKFTGYNDHSVVDPQIAYKLGDFRCTAGTSEDVNLTSVVVNFEDSSGTLEVDTSLSDVYLIYGNTTSNAKATVASTTNTWNINKVLAKGETIAIAVYADIESAIGSGDILNTDLGVAGTTVGSATAITAASTEAEGQSITIGTGTITTAETETPLDQVVFGNQTVTTANYEITAVNDGYTLTQICIRFKDANVIDAVSAVKLYDGTTLLNGESGTFVNSNGYATTTGLSLVIPANVTKTITAKIVLNSVGTGQATPGRNASTTLDTIVVRNSGGTEEYVSDDRQGNSVFVYKTFPVVSWVDVSSRQISNTVSQELYKFTVTPSTAGTIGLKQFTLGLAWNNEGPVSTANLLLDTWKLYRGLTEITTLVTFYNSAGAEASAGTGTGQTSTAVYVAFAGSTEEQISGPTTYTVKAIPANFDSGTTSSDTVTLTLSGDETAHNGTKQRVGDANGDYYWGLSNNFTGVSQTAYNFIWSDRSSVGHSAASSTNGTTGSTADWATGYKIDYLPLQSTVLTK